MLSCRNHIGSEKISPLYCRNGFKEAVLSSTAKKHLAYLQQHLHSATTMYYCFSWRRQLASISPYQQTS